VPSLRKFTVGALNAHHGIQADERFGAFMTGEPDFDGDGIPNEFSAGQVSALVAYQASLPAPLALKFENPNWQASADRGQKAFEQSACGACHISALPLTNLTLSDPGPFDTAGTLSQRDVAQPATYDLSLLAWTADLARNEKGEILVPLFGDLKRHVIADGQNSHFGNELMGQSFVPSDVFMTAELWGVADTAPYGHRADLTDLTQAILAHGGEAASARDAFSNLTPSEKDDIITFLKTLRMPK
jgi:cytochrome c peroxidase